MTKTTSEHATTDQVASKAHEAINKAAGTAGNAEEYAREQTAHADERVRDAAAQGRKQADDLFGHVNHYVRENPLMTAGMAVIAGALILSLTHRR